MASSKHKPITGVWERNPQQNLGTEVPEADSFEAVAYAKLLEVKTIIRLQTPVLSTCFSLDASAGS